MKRFIFSSLLLLGVLVRLGASRKGQFGNSADPAYFFLLDPVDGLCLAGGSFEQCSIDSLWFISGKPGHHRLHQRPRKGHEGPARCLEKVDCDLNHDSATRLGGCEACGAAKWTIVGDTENGYVVSTDEGRGCLTREGDSAKTIPCTHDFLPLSLQAISKAQIRQMESQDMELLAAASLGDLQAAQDLLLRSKADVNFRDWDGSTALHRAASAGKLAMVRLLHSQGADLRAVDSDGHTALMSACAPIVMEDDVMDDITNDSGDEKGPHSSYSGVVDYLLGHGVAVNARTSSGVTALWLAASAGRVGAMERLLTHGADANDQTEEGVSAVMTASVNQQLSAVRLLVEAGADLHTTDQDGMSALMNAAEVGSMPIVEYLLKHGASAADMSVEGFTPLIVASARGHLDVVELLLSKGAAVNTDHESGVSALMYASAGGYDDLVEFLLSHGATVDAVHRHSGGSALIEAASVGALGIVHTLLHHGADVMITDHDGINALMAAAAQGHAEVCELLIANGVDTNRVSASGGTALHFAAAAGELQVCALLLDHAAEVDVGVKATRAYLDQVEEAVEMGDMYAEAPVDGITPLHLAAYGNHLEVVRLLLASGADPDLSDVQGVSPLVTSMLSKHFAAAQALLDAGADPNQLYTDEEQRAHSALWDAVMANETELAALLVRRGANVSILDSKDRTVLMHASQRGQQLVVEALLESAGGTLVKAKDGDGADALILAATEGHSAVASLLLDRGCDPNTRDSDRTSALMSAAMRGQIEAVQVLLRRGANTNAQNVDGHTALMFAYNGRHQVASLLEKYSEKSGDSAEGMSVLAKALDTHSQIIDLLLKHGADTSIRDFEGNLAIDFDFRRSSGVADEL